MSGALAVIKGTPVIQGRSYSVRLVQMAYAAEKVVDQKNTYVYAMGHTHSPLLSRIRIRTGDATEAIDRLRARQTDADTRANLYVTFGPNALDHDMGSPAVNEPAFVNADWSGMLGYAGDNDWVSLDDPEWASGSRRRGLWKWVGDGNDVGRAKFGNPAGALRRARVHRHDRDVPDRVLAAVLHLGRLDRAAARRRRSHPDREPLDPGGVQGRGRRGGDPPGRSSGSRFHESTSRGRIGTS